MMNKKISVGTLKKWKSERDIAVKSQNIDVFKNFYKKWYLIGVYEMPLPSDRVIEISLRKMILHLNSASDEEKETAKIWLISRGYSLN